MGIFHALRRTRLMDPLIIKRHPRIRNVGTCVNQVLMSASVLQVTMAASARSIPVDLSFVHCGRGGARTPDLTDVNRAL